MPKSICAALAGVVLFWLSGCASVSVDKVTPQGRPAASPRKIYVQPFDAPTSVLRVDRSCKSLEAFRKSMTGQLAKATAERTSKRLVDAQVWSGAPPSSRAWLVTGRFLTVNQGSRALRVIFGLGAGGTKVETVVVVYDLSVSPPRPFLKFVTSGGSNAQPGAIFGLIMPNLWLSALDVLGKVGPGLNIDIVRTSREIVAVLSEYMAREGMISPAKVSPSKKLGQWP